MTSNTVPMNQDGWCTEEDSNSIPNKQKGKVMGSGFWGDEPSSTVVTEAGNSHQPNAASKNEQSNMAWAEESDKQSNKSGSGTAPAWSGEKAAGGNDAAWSTSPLKGGSFGNDSGRTGGDG